MAAAATVVGWNGRRRSSVIFAKPNVGNYAKLSAQEGSTKKDIVISTHLNGVSVKNYKTPIFKLITKSMYQEWQKRRMVYTKEKLFFALVDDDLIRDQIPLHEISKIEVMREHQDLEILLSRFGKGQGGRQGLHESRRPSTASTHKKSDHEDDSCTLTGLRVLQIGTIEKGYNSGRTYYLQTDPPEASAELEMHLSHYVEAARKRVHGNSRFKEMQSAALKIHDSTPFQVLSAVLIAAVRAFNIHMPGTHHFAIH
jgi:hypothetical protein